MNLVELYATVGGDYKDTAACATKHWYPASC